MMNSLSHYLISGAFILADLAFAFQWFLHATDVAVTYNWNFKGAEHHPSFEIRPNLDIRNRARSRAYLLASIEYRHGKYPPPLAIDNTSIWNKELKPGSIVFPESIAPVKKITSLAKAMQVEVFVRVQNGKRFWLKAQGPGQQYTRSQRLAFELREKLTRLGLPI